MKLNQYGGVDLSEAQRCIEAAVLAEREACAKVAEGMALERSDRAAELRAKGATIAADYHADAVFEIRKVGVAIRARFDQPVPSPLFDAAKKMPSSILVSAGPLVDVLRLATKALVMARDFVGGLETTEAGLTVCRELDGALAACQLRVGK